MEASCGNAGASSQSSGPSCGASCGGGALPPVTTGLPPVPPCPPEPPCMPPCRLCQPCLQPCRPCPPCPPPCRPCLPCPPNISKPACSDYSHTTTECYANGCGANPCRWDNTSYYNEGNDPSGNIVRQWNTSCHFASRPSNGSCSQVPAGRNHYLVNMQYQQPHSAPVAVGRQSDCRYPFRCRREVIINLPKEKRSPDKLSSVTRPPSSTVSPLDLITPTSMYSSPAGVGMSTKRGLPTSPAPQGKAGAAGRKLSQARKTPAGPRRPSTGKKGKSPAAAKKSPAAAKKSPAASKKSAAPAKRSPSTSKKSPAASKKSPAQSKKSASPKKSPATSKKSPAQKKSPAARKTSRARKPSQGRKMSQAKMSQAKQIIFSRRESEPDNFAITPAILDTSLFSNRSSQLRWIENRRRLYNINRRHLADSQGPLELYRDEIDWRPEPEYESVDTASSYLRKQQSQERARQLGEWSGSPAI